jgi:hypothetical protein
LTVVRYLADENFNGQILRQMRRRLASFDVITIQELQLEGAKDPVVLEFAAAQDRVLLTHDWQTMPGFAYDRLVKGMNLPGVIVVPERMPLRQILNELELLDSCSEQSEWSDLVMRLPL